MAHSSPDLESSGLDGNNFGRALELHAILWHGCVALHHWHVSVSALVCRSLGRPGCHPRAPGVKERKRVAVYLLCLERLNTDCERGALPTELAAHEAILHYTATSSEIPESVL